MINEILKEGLRINKEIEKLKSSLDRWKRLYSYDLGYGKETCRGDASSYKYLKLECIDSKLFQKFKLANIEQIEQQIKILQNEFKNL